VLSQAVVQQLLHPVRQDRAEELSLGVLSMEVRTANSQGLCVAWTLTHRRRCHRS